MGARSNSSTNPGCPCVKSSEPKSLLSSMQELQPPPPKQIFPKALGLCACVRVCCLLNKRTSFCVLGFENWVLNPGHSHKWPIPFGVGEVKDLSIWHETHFLSAFSQKQVPQHVIYHRNGFPSVPSPNRYRPTDPSQLAPSRHLPRVGGRGSEVCQELLPLVPDGFAVSVPPNAMLFRRATQREFERLRPLGPTLGSKSFPLFKDSARHILSAQKSNNI